MPFDNSGTYPLTNGFTSDGAVTLSLNLMSIAMPTSNSHSRTIVTDNLIDVTNYDSVKVAISYNGITRIISLDVDSVIGSYYITFGTFRGTSGDYSFGFCISNAKNKPYDSNVKVINTVLGVNAIVTVSRVWLSKGERIFLYKDGVQNVAWDNSGTLKPASNYTIDGTVTLNENNAVFQMPTVSAHSRSLVTNAVVDLSGYSSLKVLAVVNNVEHTYSLDISALQGSYYIALATIRAIDNRYLSIYTSTTQDLFGTNYVKAINYEVGNYAVTVSRVWLEK